MIISLKQRKFYLLPSIPFYALAFGSLLHDFVIEKLEQLPTSFFKWFRRFVYVCSTLILIFTVTKFGDFSRDEDKIKDVTRISEILDEGTIVSCTSDIWYDWSLVAYFCRIGYISLDCDNEHDYLLIKNGDEIPINYKNIELIGSNLTLQRKNTEF